MACVLYQVTSLPCQTISLFDIDQAYSGHEVVEVYRHDKWGVVDPIFGVVYQHPDKTPASTLDLSNSPGLVGANWTGRSYSGDQAWLFRGMATILDSSPKVAQNGEAC